MPDECLSSFPTMNQSEMRGASFPKRKILLFSLARKKLEFKDTCFEGVYLNNFVGFLLRNVYQKGCVANKDALRVVYAFEDKLSLLDEVYLFIS